MPEEVNIDELLDLQSDEERTKKLQVQAYPHVITDGKSQLENRNIM